MQEESDEVFPFVFHDKNSQRIVFYPTKLRDTPPNSPGLFLFVNRIGTRDIKLKIEPQNHIVGLCFLSVKHEIENMIDKFKEQGANYLFFYNCSKEQSDSIMQAVKTSKEWARIE